MNPELKTRDKARLDLRRTTGEKPEIQTAQSSSAPTPILLRLKTNSVLCFQRLTDVFNLTMLRLNSQGFWRETKSPRPQPRHGEPPQAEALPQRTNHSHATSNL